jgi:hypothetical protein
VRVTTLCSLNIDADGDNNGTTLIIIIPIAAILKLVMRRAGNSLITIQQLRSEPICKPLFQQEVRCKRTTADVITFLLECSTSL